MKFFLLVLLAAFVAGPLIADPKVEPPVALRTVAPVYPDDLRRSGVKGLVLVSCLVDPNGNVTDLAVNRSTNAAFNEAALQALKQWKFKPALSDGLPIAQKVVIPVKFLVEET